MSERGKSTDSSIEIESEPRDVSSSVASTCQTQTACWRKMLASEFDFNPQKCARNYRALLGLLGESRLNAKLSSAWQRLSETKRGNICYASADPGGMSLRTALMLFTHCASTTFERHMLAAGVFSTVEERKAVGILQFMLSNIGSYEEPRRQQELDNFSRNARRYLAEVETPARKKRRK